MNENELQIVRDLTGVAGDTIAFIDTGGTSRVYVIDSGRLVIKFPRRDATRKEYAQERSILTLLETINSDIKLPKLRWTHPDNDYLGYEGIIGRAFDEYDDSNSQTKERVGHAIGTFTKQLHSLQLDNAHRMTVDQEINQLHEKYTLIKDEISHLFSPEEQVKLELLLMDEVPRKMRQLGSDPVLCHGDLGYWNIIVDTDGTVGVIDFGDIGYYDRSKDFIGLQDKEALEAAIAVYGDDPLLRAKVAVRSQLLWILDLWFFIHVNDRNGITKIAEKIKREIRHL